MAKHILPKAEWSVLFKQLKDLIPEAFNEDGNVMNLIKGDWNNQMNMKPFNSCLDGTQLGFYPMMKSQDEKPGW